MATAFLCGCQRSARHSAAQKVRTALPVQRGRGPCADCFSLLLFRGGPPAPSCREGQSPSCPPHCIPVARVSFPTGALSPSTSHPSSFPEKKACDLSFLSVTQMLSAGCGRGTVPRVTQNPAAPRPPDGWGWGRAARLLFSAHPSSAQPCFWPGL